MNTSAVSKLLGVSSSTVQRWVKHLGLRMQRNEFGHYVYSEEDVERLRQYKEQIQNGIPIGIITEKNPLRKATVKLQGRDLKNEKMLEKLNMLERKIESKADSVVSYQLLQHRSEIEDLKSQIQLLHRQIHELMEENKGEKNNNTDVVSENLIGSNNARLKKRSMISSIFGF